ncbi:MAG: pyruvate formate lyase-activating protein [Planctomycetes bacterium SM23_32]|nr:MAG: pyruvate formate lyase-activating protein [Planctomycetes bacterium SM23_32]
MATCRTCGRSAVSIAEVLGLCAECIRDCDDVRAEDLDAVHARERARFGLPPRPPRQADGRTCRLCANACRIAAGGLGFCGVRLNRDGHLSGGTPRDAAVSWYHDPLPTNCVADWVCPAGTGAGYPEFAVRNGPERGYTNLAVFYEACSFDCLFCQNWHYKLRQPGPGARTAGELVDAVDERTTCICFFGGDPTCQLPHALTSARLARRRNPGRILRICWETNGSMAPALLERMLDLSIESGGCVKFDLKAWDPKLHRALCGADNARTLESFASAARRTAERPDPPPLIASTLLVPGYVDADEVGRIAAFIAKQDPAIPYSLLAFRGEFLMADLPTTSRAQAERCLDAARRAGLRQVCVGNPRLLGSE